ncbi:MAG TPA: hypothetical protein DDX39_08310 [Bacteroidales bacterium]|nr:MAG: hypothetical protein A2W98_09780 [Bacteroidetes bacterium GWF2_33_38]OFY73091.1 MAG: hypothetical protein A2265_00430 [Bacteroidetes bacterium RIFOXYA12_FULL_33_9]OFY90253.1 MAG: hypothetical protein A2236_04650 [Bacteroidetes bacterium RIFOXYA2_FULL_33_7]HBF88629.1 hypothetical protein [Bacteroidales bacterium]
MYTIVFDFKTHFDESIDDLVKNMNFIPFIGLNIYFEDDEVILPNDMENRGWFEVTDVDYLSNQDAFVVGLKDMGEYEAE